jgi:protein-tyrosine phosphatase
MKPPSNPDLLLNQLKDWERAGTQLDIPGQVATGEALLVAIQTTLKEEPWAGKHLGPALGKIRRRLTRLTQADIVPGVDLAGGRLAIGHRPGRKRVGDLKLQGYTHLVTLLAEKEGAGDTRDAAEKAGLAWLWLPMSSARALPPERTGEVKGFFQAIHKALKRGGQVYLHCSAGIHRTGYITYAFLLYLGLDESSARETLKQLRSETTQGVGEGRLQAARELAKAIRGNG